MTAGQYLRNSYSGRASAYHQLYKYDEAVTDWDRAVELSPKEEQPKTEATAERTHEEPRPPAPIVAVSVAPALSRTARADR